MIRVRQKSNTKIKIGDEFFQDLDQNSMKTLPYLTCGTVIELSAILVANMTLRVCGGTLLNAIFLCCESDEECKIIVMSLVRRPFLEISNVKLVHRIPPFHKSIYFHIHSVPLFP